MVIKTGLVETISNNETDRRLNQVQVIDEKLMDTMSVSYPQEVNLINKPESPYFQLGNLSIYYADFLKFIAIDQSSIDLIVTSPPYNVDIKYNSYNDKITYDIYLEFTQEWLKRAYNLLKDDGRLCLNIPLDKNKGGQQSVYSDIVSIAKKVGYIYNSSIVWNEQNWSKRTAWGSWLSASAPYVIAPVEMIVVFYKQQWKKKTTGVSDTTKDEFIKWTNGVWNFNGEIKKKIGHPSPFPVELPRRCMKLFSYKGDTVLDPFLGSGSTLIACLQTGRTGIGVDVDLKYCEIAKKRLINEQNSLQKFWLKNQEI
jgi:site-specific DNA-methyltransferase (adenine-specific)